MTHLIIKSWNGKQIRVREDRYVSLTDMAQACGKRFPDWKRTDGAKAYLEALSSVVQKSVTELLDTKQGGLPEDQGTWGHPKLAIRFAQWCDENLAVQVDCWIDELLTTGTVSLQPKTKIQLLAELTAQMAEAEQIQMRHSTLLSQHDEKIQFLESEWECYRNSDGDFVTVVGFAKRRGIQVDKSTAQSIGRKASSLYKKQTGQKPKQKEDQGYGLINIYPESLLSEIFSELGLI